MHGVISVLTTEESGAFFVTCPAATFGELKEHLLLSVFAKALK